VILVPVQAIENYLKVLSSNGFKVSVVYIALTVAPNRSSYASKLLLNPSAVHARRQQQSISYSSRRVHHLISARRLDHASRFL